MVHAVEHEPEEEMPSKSAEHLLAQKRGMTTLRSVSGWIQKKMQKGSHVRRKLSAVAQAIEISKWLPALVVKKRNSSTKSKKSLIQHKDGYENGKWWKIKEGSISLKEFQDRCGYYS